MGLLVMNGCMTLISQFSIASVGFGDLRLHIFDNKPMVLLSNSPRSLGKESIYRSCHRKSQFFSFEIVEYNVSEKICVPLILLAVP